MSEEKATGNASWSLLQKPPCRGQGFLSQQPDRDEGAERTPQDWKEPKCWRDTGCPAGRGGASWKCQQINDKTARFISNERWMFFSVTMS